MVVIQSKFYIRDFQIYIQHKRIKSYIVSKILFELDVIQLDSNMTFKGIKSNNQMYKHARQFDANILDV